MIIYNKFTCLEDTYYISFQGKAIFGQGIEKINIFFKKIATP